VKRSKVQSATGKTVPAGTRTSKRNMEYHVLWEINVWTNSPRAAAREALRIQRSVGSIATVFDITNERGRTTRVDLLEEK
jgi:hypothetical protein